MRASLYLGIRHLEALGVSEQEGYAQHWVMIVNHLLISKRLGSRIAEVLAAAWRGTRGTRGTRDNVPDGLR